ncbi:MAG: ABC transporter ATP-binding protein [Pseudomonadota bacterium]
MAPEPVFALRDVERRYGSHTALEIGALDLGEPGFTAVLGQNGSGKSTLIGLLSRRFPPSAGTVVLSGQPVGKLGATAFARRVGHLGQLMPSAPGLTVRELVGLGRFPWRGPFAPMRPQDDAIVAASIEKVALGALADRLVDTLSGGERQRAWIAMLLAQETEVLLIDEPTSALDIGLQVEALKLLRDLADQGRAIVAVLHDINLACRYADRVVALRRGRVVFDGAPRSFMEAERLSAVFDVEMCLATHPRAGTPVALVG